MENDAARATVYVAMTEHLGKEAAEAMMTVLPPWDHDEVARRTDVENLRVVVDATVVRLEAGMDQLGARIDRMGARIDQMGAQVDRMGARIDRLEAHIDARFDRQFSRLLMWTVGTVIAMGSLVVAAAALV